MPPMRILEGIHDSAAWISGGGTLRDRENHHTTRRTRLRHPRHTTPMRIRHGNHDPPTWVPDIQAHNPSTRTPPHGRRRPPMTPADDAHAAFQAPAEQGKPGPYRPRSQAASDGTTAPPISDAITDTHPPPATPKTPRPVQATVERDESPGRPTRTHTTEADKHAPIRGRRQRDIEPQPRDDRAG